MDLGVNEPATLFKDLQEQHRRTDQLLRELDRHVWLSPDEQMELARLKKEKLQLKDRMRRILVTQPGREP